MKKMWISLVAISLLATSVFAQSNEEKLAGWLKKYPQADTNNDGILTREEASAFRMKLQAKKRKNELPPPTHADVAYGPDPMNIMDLWLAPSDKPTPMLVNIHGGGFIGGDKGGISSDLIRNMNEAGISVASINYRLTEGGLFDGGKNMYPAPMHDGARAIQYLRYHAEKYKLDKSRFAATGGSAGGCMLMWLGFHDDLAEAGHEDPVLRESTRLQVLAPRGGQTTTHGPTFMEWFGVESLNLSKKAGVVQPSSAMEEPSEEVLALSLDASPITHLTPDDPPIYLFYNMQNNPVDETTPWGTWVHHPILGIKLKEAMDLYLGMECHLEYKDGPEVTDYESQQDFIIRKLKSLPAEGPAEAEMKWKTTGFRQANTMGAGEAPVPEGGKLRVFVLMGQSNMQGAGRASELEPPYTKKHERIRIWANGRWEYFVSGNRFGPGVSFAHELAEYWPDDHIGIIKISSGGTGICAFEKNWTFERAERTFDGKKGPMYQDLLNAVAEAKKISQPEFCGFFWKQGAADGTRKDLAEAYYDNFNQLISDLREDLEVPDLSVFVPVYAKDEDLLKIILSSMSEEDLQEAKKLTGKASLNDEDLLNAIVSYLYDKDPSELRKTTGKRLYLAKVLMAQNRAGREIPNVITLYPGRLPIGDDGTHYSSEGYITLGKMTASSVEEFYGAEK